jgi:hypothetical protein
MINITIDFSGTLDECIEYAASYIVDGFEISSERSEIQWPFFWIRKHYVTMRRKPTAFELTALITEIANIPPLKPEELEYVSHSNQLCLKSRLERAIASEDYELAAKLRDKINQK